jgi:large subunit ribosomal protein L21
VYAVIRTGGKQYKVKVGDVIDVERLGGDDGGNVELVPLLVVDDEGKVSSRPSELVGAKVTASVLDQHRGEKLRVFTYKNKTGQRRQQGHRQSLTRIRVEVIEPPGGAKAATREKTTTRAGGDAKPRTSRAAGTATAEAKAPEAKAKAAEAKATQTKAKTGDAKAGDAKAAAPKAKETGAKAKAAEAKDTGTKAKTTRAGGKAADTKAKAGEAKDSESKPAARGGRSRAKQDEES